MVLISRIIIPRERKGTKLSKYPNESKTMHSNVVKSSYNQKKST